MNSWNNTAINVYMSYGLWDQSWASWQTDAAAVVALLKSSQAVNVNLIMEVSKAAIDDLRGTPDNTKIDYINTTFGKTGSTDNESRVLAFYIDEPNLPTKNINDALVGLVEGRLNKPLISMIRPAGGRDAQNPNTPVTPDDWANQFTYNDYALKCEEIAGFWYPMGNSGSAEWADIEEIQDTGGQQASLTYATNNNQSDPAWFGMQSGPVGSQREPKSAQLTNIPDTGYDDKWFSAEWFWMLHSAIYRGVKGVLFYHWFYASANFRTAVHDMCVMIDDESTHKALETTPLANSSTADPSSEVVWITPTSMTDILWSYHYYSGSYWLMVMDKTPETTTGTQQLKFKVNLHDRHGSFVVLNNRYNVWQSQGRGLSLPCTNPGGTWKQYDSGTSPAVGMLSQGKVYIYRFIC
jgi:hypothetical protein